jgi:macrolide-specific efflux system membrane fusion protein
MKLKLLAIVALVAIGGGAVFIALGGSLPGGATATGAEYLTSPATTGDVIDEVAATGTIAATETWALGFGATPQVAGESTPSVGSGTWTVETVNVDVGQAVKAGDVLATASTTDLEDQLASARTSLLAARVQERAAKDALDDAEGTDATRQAKVGWYNAVNARRQAADEIDDLEAKVALATLVAPLDGTITSLNLTAGLDATGTALTIASARYEVTADVVESDIAAMSVGQEATVTVDAVDATIGGTVSAIAPAAGAGSSGVVSFPVTVSLTGAPPALRAGMTADITIVTASATDVLTIPTEALQGTAGSYRVRVLGADGVPAMRDVTVGLVTNTTAEVTSGLAEGETVVTGTVSDQLAGSDSGGRFGAGGGAVMVEGGPGPVFTRP